MTNNGEKIVSLYDAVEKVKLDQQVNLLIILGVLTDKFVKKYIDFLVLKFKLEKKYIDSLVLKFKLKVICKSGPL